jgi:hypothetical protein
MSLEALRKFFEFVLTLQLFFAGFADLRKKRGSIRTTLIEAKMRADRRRKLFRQETGWREPNYASVSVI